MSKHVYDPKKRYVYDSGLITHMTERKYRAYIAAGCKGRVDPADFGTVIGLASFNATRAAEVDFCDELNLINRK